MQGRQKHGFFRARRHMMKKFSIILLLIIIIFVITMSGCSNEGENGAAKDAAANVTESIEDDEAIVNARAIGEAATNVSGEYKDNVTKVEIIWDDGKQIKNAKMENGKFSWNIFPGLKKGSKLIVQAYENDKVIDKDEIIAD